MSEFAEKSWSFQKWRDLLFSNFGEVVSVCKGRHEFNRKIGNGRKQVKIFPAGRDPMILLRKTSFHGSIQKKKVVLCYRCKIRYMHGKSCHEATLSPEDCSMSFIEQNATPQENLAVEPASGGRI